MVKVSDSGDYFSFWFLIFCGFLAISLIISALNEAWFWTGGIVIFGIFWIFLSIRKIDPVHAAVVLRFGRRVILEEEISCYRIVDNKKKRINDEELSDPDFDSNAPDIEVEMETTYLIKKEGWCIVFPIIEELVIFSLAIQEEMVDAENVYTQGGVLIVPKTFATWRISNLAAAVELEGGGERVNEATRDAIRVSERDLFATCTLDEALSKKRALDPKHPDEPPASLSTILKDEIAGLVSRWGVTLLELRVADIQPVPGVSDDVFQNLEAAKNAELIKEKERIEAEKDLQVRTIKAKASLVEKQREADGIKAIADANFHRGQREADVLKAQVGAFVGKAPNDLKPEDGERFGQYQVGIERAKSLANNTKVIVVPNDPGSKIVAGLSQIFNANKEV